MIFLCLLHYALLSLSMLVFQWYRGLLPLITRFDRQTKLRLSYLLPRVAAVIGWNKWLRSFGYCNTNWALAAFAFHLTFIWSLLLVIWVKWELFMWSLWSIVLSKLVSAIKSTLVSLYFFFVLYRYCIMTVLTFLLFHWLLLTYLVPKALLSKGIYLWSI